MGNHKLINIQTKEEHLCDKVVLDGFEYYVSDEAIEEGWRGTAYKKDVKGQIFKHFYTTNEWYKDAKKVIAANDPNIDIPKVVDEIEELAKNIDKTKCRNFRRERTLKEVYEGIEDGFILGYNKSQETHPFSEEDMIDFVTWISEYDLYIPPSKEILQLWKEQRPKIVYYE